MENTNETTTKTKKTRKPRRSAREIFLNSLSGTQRKFYEARSTVSSAFGNKYEAITDFITELKLRKVSKSFGKTCGEYGEGVFNIAINFYKDLLTKMPKKDAERLIQSGITTGTAIAAQLKTFVESHAGELKKLEEAGSYALKRTEKSVETVANKLVKSSERTTTIIEEAAERLEKAFKSASNDSTED